MKTVLTAGHVDHGKSTLVRALTGMEPDRWEEERRRGLTIDLGFVWSRLQAAQRAEDVAFVDAPGHRRFIANMLSGAGAVGLALFVVAADDGWAAQSEEHLRILDLLKVRGVGVAITKADTVSSDRVSAVMRSVSDRLGGTTLEGVPVVAVDSLSGHGLEQLTAHILDCLAAGQPAVVPSGTRLWIDRAFTVPGAGTVVTGTHSGPPLRRGQDIELAPGRATVRVRGLQSLGREVVEAVHGSRVAVNLARIGAGEVSRGDALLSGDWVLTTAAEVELQSVHVEEISDRGSWSLHVGSASSPVRVRPILGDIGPQATGVARLDFDHPLPLRHGDRFILRSSGVDATVGGGRILDPSPRSWPRGTIGRLQHAEDLEILASTNEPEEQVRALVQLGEGLRTSFELRASLGGPDPGQSPGTHRLGEYVVSDELLARWLDQAKSALAGASSERGVYLSFVEGELARGGCPEVLRRPVIDELTSRGDVDLHGDILTTVEDTAAYQTARRDRQDRVVQAMSENVLRPPDFDELVARESMVGSELNELFSSGVLVRIAGHVFHASVVTSARRMLSDAFGEREFTASEARQTLDTTRKHLIPLLEHLARLGVTQFNGERHRITVDDT